MLEFLFNTLLKTLRKEVQHRRFPVNVAKFLKTAFCIQQLCWGTPLTIEKTHFSFKTLILQYSFIVDQMTTSKSKELSGSIKPPCSGFELLSMERGCKVFFLIHP